MLRKRLDTAEDRVEEIDHVKLDSQKFEERVLQIDRENQMVWEGLSKVEKHLRETESYIDR
jgi:hypothetical protein